MRYLGLDLGSKTLGVALSDKSGLIASSLTIIRHDEDYDGLLSKIKDLIFEYKVEEIVLGFPKNMNNTIGPKGELSLQFKQKLEEATNLKVNLVDERLSTKEATNILLTNDTSRKKRKKVIDSMAACIILQSYLDRK